MAGIEPATVGLRSNPRLHHRRSFMQGFRAFPSIDPSFLHAARTTSPPRQEAGLEIRPSFPRTSRLRHIPTPRLPKIPERTVDTALPFGDRSLFPGKACSQFFPDAEVLDPVSQHGSSSS